MSDPSPSNILFSSRYKYFLNYDEQEGTKTIAATTVATFTDEGTLSIPINSDDNFLHVYINLSTDSSNWYKYPLADQTLNANVRLATTGTRTGDNFILHFYLTRYGAGTSSPEVTIIAKAYLFETPE